MNKVKAAEFLKELKEIYNREGCYSFDKGIDSTIKELSDSIIQNDAPWQRAASLYRTMAGSKSGFSDVYVDAGTSQERVQPTSSWTVFGNTSGMLSRGFD
ncbi:hypothetical protein [Pseudomonas sp. H9]|uniref:hypothetical protein n=1 Tax=Pseudomonas sp. H9 TaxID=483968 RepID=UPI0021149170|nr:hypothetical protein [Pseudomonas sp. H9]